jgi:hypothetical protein
VASTTYSKKKNRRGGAQNGILRLGSRNVAQRFDNIDLSERTNQFWIFANSSSLPAPLQ